MDPSASNCLVADTSNPLIFSDSPAFMKEDSICNGTLASPLYMYSTKDFRFSKSMPTKWIIWFVGLVGSAALNMP